MGSEHVDDKPGVSGFRRYGLVGAALFGVIAVLLVGGYVLGTHLRPPIGMEQVALPASSVPALGVASAAPTVSAVSAAAVSVSPRASGAVATDVEQAYLRYWSVYSDAMLTLDPSHLADVASGERLQQAMDEVQKVKAQGKAAKIDVQHSVGVFDVTETTASVHDSYINNSYSIDPSTRKPLGSPGQTQQITDTYTLQRIAGVWKVVSGIRESG